MQKMGGKEMADYFGELLVKLEEIEPEIAEAMKVFREAESNYRQTIDAMNVVTGAYMVESLSSNEEWENNASISTTS